MYANATLRSAAISWAASLSFGVAAALWPMRKLTLLARIHELASADSQFLIATHSPILLSFPDATIYELSAAGWRVVRYEDTEHFQVTRDFLNRYPAMLRTLFAR